MKSICPITYTPLLTEEKYSSTGLKLLSPSLKTLKDLPLSMRELRIEAINFGAKLSISGVQYKLGAKLNVKNSTFEFTTQNAKFIIKPQSDNFLYLPENEDLSMRLAKCIGIETPLHGLIYNTQGELSYFIKRFDRGVKSVKYPVEDFAQLSNQTRLSKYQSSMEKVAGIIDRYCTFPLVEKEKLFQRTLFNFIIGNEDMHLKNFSLITKNHITTLTPAYDFLNSTLVIPNTKEEIALPINGKKRNLTKKDLINYFGQTVLKLPNHLILKNLDELKSQFPQWEHLIKLSFLPDEMKTNYLEIVILKG